MYAYSVPQDSLSKALQAVELKWLHLELLLLNPLYENNWLCKPLPHIQNLQLTVTDPYFLGPVKLHRLISKTQGSILPQGIGSSQLLTFCCGFSFLLRGRGASRKSVSEERQIILQVTLLNLNIIVIRLIQQQTLSGK